MNILIYILSAVAVVEAIAYTLHYIVSQLIACSLSIYSCPLNLKEPFRTIQEQWAADIIVPSLVAFLRP